MGAATAYLFLDGDVEHTGTSSLARHDQRPDSLGSTAVDPNVELKEGVISPELVLVCPELRRRALDLLPERDPDGFLPRRDVRWQLVDSMVSGQAPLSRLRLVDPPLAESPPALAAAQVAPSSEVPVALAALAYLARRTMEVLVVDAVAMAAVIAAAILLDVVHP